MSNRPKHPTFDAALEMEDGAGAYVASNVGEVGGVARVIQVGASIPGDWAEGADAETQITVDVVAAVDTDTTETYQIDIEGSVDEAFTVPVKLGCVVIPIGSVNRRLNGIVHLVREGASQTDEAFAFLRTNAILGGTAPSLQYSAYAGQSQLARN